MAAPTVISRYQIRDRLGHGGMGVLYLALDPAIDRLVAVKLLRVNNPEIRERFIREAQVAARLQHPHIVTVYDVGTHEGQPFIAMEYIAGETLGELIHRRAPLALSRKIELMADVCEGLAYAHKRGVVHRDVKPANIMVNRESGSVKILDFGIARIAGSSLTQVGMVMGTPNYMSPEQIAGQPVDHRSDIFAVGAVLYELLVHRQAFSGDTPHAVLHQIISVEPASVTSFNPDLDPQLDDILHQAMAKAPADRYQDLQTMRGDLLRVSQQLEAQQGGHTVVVDPQQAAGGPTPMPTPRGGRAGPDRARIAERRAARIASHVQSAESALTAGALEDALAQIELGAEIEPDDPRIVRLHERIRAAIDARDCARFLHDARANMAGGALTEAERLLSEALQLEPASPAAQALRRDLERELEQRERLREQTRKAHEAVVLAREYFEGGAFDAALRASSEALGYRPDDAEALALRQQVREAIERRAQDAIAEARQYAARGRFDAAIAVLQRVRPPNDNVDALLDELEVARARAERERAAREQAAREQAEREQAQREQAAREQAERERAQRERAAREQAEREQAQRERAAREQAERERAAREQAEREQAQREKAAREQAEREQAQREKAAQEQAERERAERERAQQARAAREQAERTRLAQQQEEEARQRAFETWVSAHVDALDEALREGRWADAREVLRALLARAPDTPGLAERRERIERGVEAERRAKAVQHLLSEARSCLQAGEYEDAWRAVREATSLDPKGAAAAALAREIQAAEAEAERRARQEALREDARRACDEAGALASAGHFERALARLDAAPADPIVAEARARIRDARDRHEQGERARLEAAREAARRFEEERRQVESERLRAERAALEDDEHIPEPESQTPEQARDLAWVTAPPPVLWPGSTEPQIDVTLRPPAEVARTSTPPRSAARSARTWVAVLIGAALAVALGSWFAWRALPRPVGPPQPSFAQAQAQIDRLIGAGNLDEAAGKIETGLLAAPQDPRFRAQLGEVAARSAGRTTAARNDAVQAGAGKQATFVQAIDREAAAQKQAEAAQIVQAVASYRQAEALFRDAINLQAQAGRPVEGIRRLLADGRLADAADQVVRALAATPADSTLSGLARDVTARAKQNVGAIKKQAVDARAQGQPEFQEAVTREREANGLTQPEQTVLAVNAYEQARARYASAIGAQERQDQQQQSAARLARSREAAGRIQGLVNAGNLAEAAAQIVRARVDSEDQVTLQRLAQDVAAGAQQRMGVVKKQAADAGGQEQGAFARGVAQERMARGLDRPEQVSQAVDAYQRAGELYREALTRALASQKKEGSGTPPPPPIPTTEPKATTGNAQTSGPNLKLEEAAIRQLLDEYARAYEQMDEARLHQIDPSFRGLSAQTRALLKSVRLSFSGVAIKVAGDGQSAVLQATQNFEYDWKRAGIGRTSSGTLAWKLAKNRDGWAVVP